MITATIRVLNIRISNLDANVKLEGNGGEWIEMGRMQSKGACDPLQLISD